MAAPKINNHGDFTGREKARLAAEHAEETALRAKELSLINQQEKDFANHSTVDLTQGSPIILEDDGEVMELNEDYDGDDKTIRVNSDIEHMTLGAGTDYNFTVGQKYRVPQHVADHLEEKGLVWH